MFDKEIDRKHGQVVKEQLKPFCQEASYKWILDENNEFPIKETKIERNEDKDEQIYETTTKNLEIEYEDEEEESQEEIKDRKILESNKEDKSTRENDGETHFNVKFDTIKE